MSLDGSHPENMPRTRKDSATQGTPRESVPVAMESILAATDLREALRNELARRCARNPRYSLRAFARHLGTDHSTLSQILRGRRALAVRTIERMCTRLGIDKDQRERFVVAERMRRRQTADEPEQIRRLGRDAMLLLSDWRHFAVLELTRLDAFKPDSRWIARVLGASVDDVNIVVQRLLRFGLLQMTDAGRWTANGSTAPITFSELLDAVALRLSTRGASLPAATTECDYRPGDRSETTLAVDSRRVNAAIEIMERCRSDVAKLLTSGDQKDDVYRLEISLLPATITKP
jgi:uncharacterized protein (TIGR02147 family)